MARQVVVAALALALAGCPPPAAPAPPPPVATPSPAPVTDGPVPPGVLSAPDLVVVEDGRGAFAVANVAAGSLLVGLDAGSFTGSATEIRTASPGGGGTTQAWSRGSLVVYERRSTGPSARESVLTEYLLADGVSVAAIASELRVADPSKIDVRALIERVKKKP